MEDGLIGRVHELEDGPAQDLLPRAAEDLRHGLIQVGSPGAGIDRPDALVGGLEQAAQPGLAGPQLAIALRQGPLGAQLGQEDVQAQGRRRQGPVEEGQGVGVRFP